MLKILKTFELNVQVQDKKENGEHEKQANMLEIRIYFYILSKGKI